MPEEDTQSTVDINYLKSVAYREVACDGAIGSLTPKGKLWLAFYTERLPLPRIVRHELISSTEPQELRIDPDKPGVTIDGRAGVVRNVEFGLYLSVSTARKLHEWLGSQLEASGRDEK
jgi:hypothetical protein